MNDSLLYACAWISVATWTLAAWLEARRGHAGWARWAATLAFLALLAHTALAFELRFGWSQAAARLDIERQTRAMFGRPAPEGLYVNYLFLLLWAVEIAAWWIRPAERAARGPLVRWALRAVFLMIFANGAVIFVAGPLRYVGAGLILLTLWAWLPERRDSRYRVAGAAGASSA